MAEPGAVVPYHDPYDTTYTDEIFNFIDNSNPTFSDLSLFVDSSLHPSTSNPQPGGDVLDTNDPYDDPVLWDIVNGFNGGSSEAGPSDYRPETSNREGLENENVRNMKNLSFWPAPPVPYLCSCCLVLREIIHTNGHDTTKLEIHGRLGMICHAILEIRQSMNIAIQYQMVDFCKKSIEDVKKFLVQYCDERKQAGFVILPDPLSIFYEALCVGLVVDENPTTDDFFQPPPNNSGANEMDQPEVENYSERIPKTSLAVQRERTGKLTLTDLSNYFHLPIEEAAKKMKLCPTVVKKICRRYGLHRWPHRKIKSLERQISSKTARLSSTDAEERANAQAEIQRLRQEMALACAGVSN